MSAAAGANAGPSDSPSGSPSGSPSDGPGGVERAVPFYCPYCAEEDLRPLDAAPGRYACGACRRAFELRFLGVASGH